LRQIAAMDGSPHRTTIRRWQRDNEEFRSQYARACEEEADNLFDDMQETIRAKLPENIDEAKNEIQLRRLEIDTLKWQLAKRQPKKYGDKLEIGGSITHKNFNKDVSEMSDEELDALIKGEGQ
jgi:hypothetical protein